MKPKDELESDGETVVIIFTIPFIVPLFLLMTLLLDSFLSPSPSPALSRKPLARSRSEAV